MRREGIEHAGTEEHPVQRLVWRIISYEAKARTYKNGSYGNWLEGRDVKRSELAQTIIETDFCGGSDG
jgi:hypothetical protein